MQPFKLTLVSALVLGLAACGGGGGGGGGSAPASEPAPMNTPTETVTPSTPAESASKTEPTVEQAPTVEVTPPVETTPTYTLPNAGWNIDKTVLPKGEFKNVDVGYGKITGYNNDYSVNGAWHGVPASEIDVEGVKLALSKLSGLAGVQNSDELSQALSFVTNAEKNLTRKGEVFYFGSETPVADIPSAGVYTYKGVATRYDNLKESVANIGTSTLVANFDTKKISGDLVMDGLRRNISLKSADIVGNGFEGKAVVGEGSLLINRTGTYEGKFFGPNADEVAGKATFKDVSDLDTSFSGDLVEKKFPVTK